MQEPILFPYQVKAEEEISKLFQKGHRKILAVAPGGSGKTVVSGSITKKFHIKQSLNSDPGKVAFFVHRDELFNQTREEFLLFGTITEAINADTSIINPNANTFVCMVETFARRADSETFLKNFKKVKLLFIDEAHRDDFSKIFQYFENARVIGWTATPISSNKKRPMNKQWDVMYEVATVTDLQRLNSIDPKVGVVECDPYMLTDGVDRNKLKRKGDDFDERLMSKDFREGKQLSNTLDHYFELAKGLKGLCFNCDIQHNEDMHNEFKASGIESRMLHSDAKKWYGAPKSSLMKHWRKDTLLWLKHTPGSILNNVGILTTGFNERSTELIITNYSTLSISKFIQCIVRGARPFQYENGDWKEFYRLLDFGQNLKYFNTNGNDNIPWQSYFDMPSSTHNRDGVGGYKSCPNCGSLVAVSTRFCEGLKENWLSQELEPCDYQFPISEKLEDLVPRIMIKFFTDGINVDDMVSLARINGRQIASVYFRILERICEIAKDKFGAFLLKEQFEFILDMCFKKLKELSKYTQKRTWRDGVKSTLIPKLREAGIAIDIEELGDESLLEELKEKERRIVY